MNVINEEEREISDVPFSAPNDLYGTTTSMPLHKVATPIDNTKKGDWVYFENKDDYGDLHEDGDFAGENAITVLPSPNARFWGWGGDPPIQTYGEWCQTLVDAYNSDLPDSEKIDSVPGYTGKATFIDVASLGMTVFDHRESDASDGC